MNGVRGHLFIGSIAFIAATVGYLVHRLGGVDMVVSAIQFIALPVLVLGLVFTLVGYLRQDELVSVPFLKPLKAEGFFGRLVGLWMLVTFPFGLGGGERWEP